MDPLARLIAHHASALSLAIELGVIVLVALGLALVWWRGGRRRKRPPAEMRDD